MPAARFRLPKKCAPPLLRKTGRSLIYDKRSSLLTFIRRPFPRSLNANIKLQNSPCLDQTSERTLFCDPRHFAPCSVLIVSLLSGIIGLLFLGVPAEFLCKMATLGAGTPKRGAAFPVFSLLLTPEHGNPGPVHRPHRVSRQPNHRCFERAHNRRAPLRIRGVCLLSTRQVRVLDRKAASHLARCAWPAENSPQTTLRVRRRWPIEGGFTCG